MRLQGRVSSGSTAEVVCAPCSYFAALRNTAPETVSAAGGAGGIGPGGQMTHSYGGTGGGGLISIQALAYLNQGTVTAARGWIDER